jgi:hypothetical protein
LGLSRLEVAEGAVVGFERLDLEERGDLRLIGNGSKHRAERRATEPVPFRCHDPAHPFEEVQTYGAADRSLVGQHVGGRVFAQETRAQAQAIRRVFTRSSARQPLICPAGRLPSYAGAAGFSGTKPI